MSPDSLRVRLGQRSYDIAITSGDLTGAGPFARPRVQGRLALVVSDVNAAPHADAVRAGLERAGFRTAVAVRPSGEAQKSLDVARELYDALLDLHADRRTLVVAVGGGVV